MFLQLVEHAHQVIIHVQDFLEKIARDDELLEKREKAQSILLKKLNTISSENQETSVLQADKVRFDLEISSLRERLRDHSLELFSLIRFDVVKYDSIMAALKSAEDFAKVTESQYGAFSRESVSCVKRTALFLNGVRDLAEGIIAGGKLLEYPGYSRDITEVIGKSVVRSIGAKMMMTRVQKLTMFRNDDKVRLSRRNATVTHLGTDPVDFFMRVVQSYHESMQNGLREERLVTIFGKTISILPSQLLPRA